MCADGSPMVDLLASLRRWEGVKRRWEELGVELAELAKPLEDAARARRGWRFALLAGQDRDGRLRFLTMGGEVTMSLEELAGGS